MASEQELLKELGNIEKEISSQIGSLSVSRNLLGLDNFFNAQDFKLFEQQNLASSSYFESLSGLKQESIGLRSGFQSDLNQLNFLTDQSRLNFNFAKSAIEERAVLGSLSVKQAEFNLDNLNEVLKAQEAQSSLGLTKGNLKNQLRGARQTLRELGRLQGSFESQIPLVEDLRDLSLQASGIRSEALEARERATRFTRNEKIGLERVRAITEGRAAHSGVLQSIDAFNQDVSFSTELTGILSQLDAEEVTRESTIVNAVLRTKSIEQSIHRVKLQKINARTRIKSIKNRIKQTDIDKKALDRKMGFIKKLGTLGNLKFDIDRKKITSLAKREREHLGNLKVLGQVTQALKDSFLSTERNLDIRTEKLKERQTQNRLSYEKAVSYSRYKRNSLKIATQLRINQAKQESLERIRDQISDIAGG